jgi:hypothetical protein
MIYAISLEFQRVRLLSRCGSGLHFDRLRISKCAPGSRLRRDPGSSTHFRDERAELSSGDRSKLWRDYLPNIASGDYIR